MYDEDLTEDDYAAKEQAALDAEPMRARRRRLYIRLPRSYELFRLAAAVLTGSAAWGVILGDIWLWRLLYG